jgi:hypothetical protein
MPLSKETLAELLEEDKLTREKRVIWNDVVRDLKRAVKVIDDILKKKTDKQHTLDSIMSATPKKALGKAKSEL